MAFKARLDFSGKEHHVFHVAYSLNPDVDAKGRLSSRKLKVGIANHINDWPKA
ncbi:hypothetical protein SAMN05421820_101109 [Pedobacter steynii]|uniref:Uncharacterized protein n=1 Tax=Pedobacter steynii TaxID=430522 RepID=A0A1G9J070_9SPHI|nr:hypothetical protein [Pedobacter steynii]NQX38101.1 hypothetical protein [Pedobacter steynii]SDL30869.1 hypothetical protein SAMN05421820_101109 [Pedobacter steynii]